MSNQTRNQAAWLMAPKTKLEVSDAPFPVAGPGQVVVKNYAIAINPAEWKIQEYDILPTIKYPAVLGGDLAGEVYEVGEGVVKVKKGDRVMGFAVSLINGDPAQGAYQKYTIVPEAVVAKIPTSMSFTDASVLPLNISTAALLLFKPETLGLPFPPAPGIEGPKTNKSILVWGGSSSVGACVIQIAVAAGVKVVAVAGKHNLDKLIELGASAAFDYRSPSVIPDIVSSLNGTDFAGVCDAIGDDASKSWGPVYEMMGRKGKLGTVFAPKDVPEGMEGCGVGAAFIVTPTEKAICEAIWGEWIEEALEKGIMKAAPPAVVVGRGVGELQGAMERQKEGVSFAKIVVEV